MANGEHLKLRVGVDKKSLTTSANEINKAFQSFGKTIATVFSVSALASFAKSAVELASDVEEVQNVVDVSFGEMRDQMEAFADTAIETYGISRLTAKRTGSTYMAMAKGMGIAGQKAADMALSLTGLSADMASFYNVSQEYTNIALKSVFTGETETLKQYGIVMTQTNLQEFARQKGIKKSIQSMTQQEQTMLRYQYIMKQTALAQGDFVRTQDSWANQTRKLAEEWKEVQIEFGQTFKELAIQAIPVLKTILQYLSRIGQYLSKTFGRVEDTTKSTSNNISSAADNQKDLADATKEATKEAEKQLAAFDEINDITKDTKSSENIEDELGEIGSISAAGKSIKSARSELSEETKATMDLMLATISPFIAIIGVILLFSGHIFLGLSLIISGIALFKAASAELDYDKVPAKTKQMCDKILAIGGALFTAIGVILCFTGNLPMGITMLLTGLPMLGYGLENLDYGALWDELVDWCTDISIKWLATLKKMNEYTKKYWGFGIYDKWYELNLKTTEIAENIVNGFIDAFVWAANKAKDIFRFLFPHISDWMGITGDEIKINHITLPRPPKLATGAVLPANKPFLAQLGDQKNGRNLEAPESLLREVYEQENQPIVSILQELLAVVKEGKVIMADDRVLAKTVKSGEAKLGNDFATGGMVYAY